MFPRVTSETEYLALFHSISQLTHPLGRSVYLTINPSCSTQICTQFESNSTQVSIQKSTVCGNSFGLSVLRRCDIMLHWQTFFNSKIPKTISLYWELDDFRENILFWSVVQPSMTVVSFQSAQMNITVYVMSCA